MIDAKPTNVALDFLINLTHSILDLPVVITSSTIKTFDPFFILKPLLKENFPFNLSQKIVYFFRSIPISYPIIIPPIAGAKIKSIFLNDRFILLASDLHILSAL